MNKLIPYPHQVAASHYLKKRGGGYLYMKPRTGKALSTIITVEEEPPILIICPASVMAVWESDLLRQGIAAEDIMVCDFRQRYATRVEDYKEYLTHDKKFFIINFEKVVTTQALDVRKKLPKVLGRDNWKWIVVDESYKIANMDTAVGEYIGSHKKPKGQKRVVLSGYPAPESPLNFANQVAFVDNTFFNERYPQNYRKKYWKSTTIRRTFTIWNAKNKLHLQDIKNWVDKNTYQISLEELGLGGEKLHEVITLRYSENVAKYVKYFTDAKTFNYPDDKEGRAPRALEPIMKNLFLHKVANGMHPFEEGIFDLHKYEWVRDYIKDMGKERFLITAKYILSIETMAKVLNKAGIIAEVIYGEVSLAERSAIQSRHRKGTTQVVVAQVHTVKMGLDFSFCNTHIILNNDYSFDARSQVEERLQNTQRTTPYNIMDICMGPIENRIVDTLVVKKENVDYIMGNDEKGIVNG